MERLLHSPAFNPVKMAWVAGVALAQPTEHRGLLRGARKRARQDALGQGGGLAQRLTRGPGGPWAQRQRDLVMAHDAGHTSTVTTVNAKLQ